MSDSGWFRMLCYGVKWYVTQLYKDAFCKGYATLEPHNKVYTYKRYLDYSAWGVEFEWNKGRGIEFYSPNTTLSIDFNLAPVFRMWGIHVCVDGCRLLRNRFW